MKRIYFDQNIWIDIQEKRNDLSLELMKKIINYEKVQLIYSPANCEEICNSFRSNNIKNKISEDKKNERVSIISTLTKNTEIVPYPNSSFNVIESPFGNNGPQIIKEAPLICYGRVNENYESNEIAENNQQLIIDAGKNVDQKTKIMLSTLNPVEDILKSDKGQKLICSSILAKSIFGDATLQLMKEGILRHPISHDKLQLINNRARLLEKNLDTYISNINSVLSKSNKFDVISSDYSEVETYIDSIVLALIELGYASENRSMSSLHDVSHIIYGSYCDYFVTRDEKLMKKAIPTYNYLNIATKVIDASDDDWTNILKGDYT